jgi:hypothetical protein
MRNISALRLRNLCCNLEGFYARNLAVEWASSLMEGALKLLASMAVV